MRTLLFESFQGSRWAYDIETGVVHPEIAESILLPEDRSEMYFYGIRQVKLEDLFHPEEDLNAEKFVAEAFLTLSVTEDCSNRCSYCIFGGRYPDERLHSSRVLALSDAIKAVDEFCHDVGSAVRNFSFYGGEPMFASGFDVVRGVVAHIKDKCTEGVNRFTLTTNGNHFTPETVRFLIENDFHVGVSLDGPRDIHDRNRRTLGGAPTFNRIMDGLSLIYRTNREYYRKNVRFICVLNPPLEYEKVSAFFSSNELVWGNDIMVSNVSLFGQSYYTEEIIHAFSMQTINMVRTAAQKLYSSVRNGTVFAQAFERGLFFKELMILRSRFRRSPRFELDLLGRCLPGRFKRFLATDGTYYTCEKMQGYYPIGSLTTGIDMNRVLRMVNEHESLIKIRCPRCPYAKICTLCYVAACGDRRLFDSKRLDENCIERRSFSKLLLRLYASLVEELGDDGFEELLRSGHGMHYGNTFVHNLHM